MSVCSSTGISAQLLGEFKATTIHSWAGLYYGRHNTSDLIDLIEHDLKHEQTKSRIQKCNVLIIDEISMISAKIFDQLESVTRCIRGNNCPFGGIQVILSGDFYQLPPIPCIRYGDDGMFCLENCNISCD